MNKNILLFVSISLICGITGYLATNNIIVSLLILIIFLIYFIFIANRKLTSSKKMIFSFHRCYHFINSFIISLSINPSINNALKCSVESLDKDFKNTIDEIYELCDEDKLKYLEKEFPFHVYTLFLNIINIWNEEGGDILKMSSQLMDEILSIEQYLISSERICFKKTIEFSILWSIALMILIILRFALHSFFNKITNQVFYPICIGLFFLFLLISIHLLIIKVTKTDLKGFSHNEMV